MIAIATKMVDAIAFETSAQHGKKFPIPIQSNHFDIFNQYSDKLTDLNNVVVNKTGRTSLPCKTK